MKPSIIEQKGYSWVSLPKAGIEPLTLLVKEKEGFFTRIKHALLGIEDSANALNADIFALFKKKRRGSYPKISKPKAVAAFSGHDILSNNVQIDISGLKALKAIGSAELESKVNRSKKRLFSFKQLQRRHVITEILLEEHLNVHHPNSQAVGFMDSLQKGNMYVVTEVLQTQEFSVKDASDFSFSTGLDAKAVDEYVASLKASAGVSSENEDKLVYKNKVPLTFALKAYKINYNENTEKYSISKKALSTARGISRSETQSDIVPEELGLSMLAIE